MPSESNDQTPIWLRVLDEVQAIRKDTHAIEVRQEAHRIELVEIKRRLDVANGRTAKVEDRLDKIEARHDRDDGEENGRKAERDRMYAVARIASKPVTWAVGGVIGAVGYIVKDRAG